MTARVPRRPRRDGSAIPARVPALAAAAAVLGLLLTGCSTAPDAGGSTAGDTPVAASPSPSASSEPTTAPAPAPQAADPNVQRSVGVEPASLTVPKMELTENLIPLGIQSNGEMEVPVDYDDVGWFTGGGKPGGFGPTVIAGHVDSRSGPAVFYRLGELVEGDRFSLTGTDGTVFDYEVYAVENHAKAAFPTANVFGATLADEVRLITCGGEYDTSIGRYVDNVVVFAKKVDAAA